MSAYEIKLKTMETILRGLEAEEPQAAMVGQAINFLKVFRDELDAPIENRTIKVADLSGSMKALAEKHGYNA